MIISIGDDCAAVKPQAGSYSLLTADISIEGVHFSRTYCSAGDIGWKAMTANISDIAAMGGESAYALVSLGIPPDTDEEFVLDLYNGIIEAANGPKIAIIGGDISRSEKLVVSIALYGQVDAGKEIRRNGACPGEFLYVTGKLGGSHAGLELLKNGIVDEQYHAFYARHRRPAARYELVRDIIAQFAPTAMIDISDGLISDARHLCEESGVGVCLYGDRVPLCEGLDEYAKSKGKRPLDYALASGEEYELLFASKKWLADTIHLYINEIPVSLIGEVRESGFAIELDGVAHELDTYGYDHFAE